MRDLKELRKFLETSDDLDGAFTRLFEHEPSRAELARIALALRAIAAAALRSHVEDYLEANALAILDRLEHVTCDLLSSADVELARDLALAVSAIEWPNLDERMRAQSAAGAIRDALHSVVTDVRLDEIQERVDAAAVELRDATIAWMDEVRAGHASPATTSRRNAASRANKDMEMAHERACEHLLRTAAQSAANALGPVDAGDALDPRWIAASKSALDALRSAVQSM